MKRAKVFCVGGHKTGTTSMGEALGVLGYRVFPERLWYDDATLRDEFYADDYARLWRLIDDYEAFEDSPFNHSDVYRRLYQRHPEAKYILTVRETANVIGSYRRFFDKIDRLVLDRDQELKSYVRFFFQHEYGLAEPLADDAQLARVYETRNRAVVEFFGDKPDQFLEIDLEKEPAPWQRLCEFLAEPVPATPFPHLKRTK